MKKQIDNYFLNITDEDMRHHKQLVAKVRKNTTNMLRAESQRLFSKGF